MSVQVKDDAQSLAYAVKRFLESLDDEFDHGHYGPPDTIPPGHEDEENYYEEHDKIVEETAQLRLQVEALVDKIRGTTHA